MLHPYSDDRPAVMVLMTRHVALVLLVPVAFFLQAWTRPDTPVRRDDAQQPIELIFSHQLHVDDMGLVCDDCHADVEASTTGRDNLLPSMETCGDCHEVEDFDNCGLCHSNEDDPREVPRIDTYSPPFSHARHLTSGLECVNCHAEVAQQTTAEPVSLPAMVTCIDCHEDRGVARECSTCHLPSDRLTPDSHTPDFVHTHSDLARHADLAGEGEDKTCQTCHDDDFCQDCHQGDILDRLRTRSTTRSRTRWTPRPTSKPASPATPTRSSASTATGTNRYCPTPTGPAGSITSPATAGGTASKR
jgi:hypothetical protein